MGFGSVGGFSGLIADLRRTLRRPGDAKPDQVFKNMDSDAEIPNRAVTGGPTSRLEMLQELGTDWPPSERDRRKAVREFCHAHTQEGPEDAAAADASLMRATDLRRVARDLLTWKSDLRLKETVAQLRDAVELPADEGTRLDYQKGVIGGLIGLRPLSVYQMWGCYAEPGNPLPARDASRLEIVVRLGLGDLKGRKESVHWRYELPPAIRPHRPTAWDAGIGFPWWRPGGRTQPLPGHRWTLGFPEVVHDSISAESLTRSIKRAR